MHIPLALLFGVSLTRRELEAERRRLVVARRRRHWHNSRRGCQQARPRSWPTPPKNKCLQNIPPPPKIQN
eukprot:4877125-Pyramimonas_sp.AAC.1